MSKVVNEGSTHFVTAAFADEAGQPVTPVSGTWRVDDVASGTVMVGETAFTPTGAEHTFTIPAAANAMVSASKAWEERRLTITFAYPGGQGTGDYFYQVKNLGGIP